MRIASAFAVLLAAASLAAQTFPERPAASLAYFQNDEQVTALGTDGADFLAVGFRYPAGMIANRITAAGQLLDGTGIVIARLDPTATPRLLGVIWGGDAYTILWQAGAVYAARVDRDGRLIEGPRSVILTNALFWGAASNGSRIVLAGGRAIALDLRGNVLDDFGVVPGDAQQVDHYSVAWNGSGFMMSWASNLPGSAVRYVNVAPLDASGRPLGTFGKVAANAFETHIASDGNDYVAIAGADDLVAYHVSAAGQILESHTVPGSFRAERSIVWSGGKYVVAAVASQTPSVIRLDRGGAVDGAPVSIASVGLIEYASGMLAATNGTQVLLAWQLWSESGTRSYAAFAGGGAFALGVTPTVQMAPRIADSGRNFMVVWEEKFIIYASRLSYAGEPLDGRGKRLSTRIGEMPRVVWDGQTYVVAWFVPESAAISTSHITPEGVVLDASEKPAVGSCRGEFDLATDGDTAFVVATDCLTSRVQGARVHRDGIAEPSVAVSPAGEIGTMPRLAWNGARYLVAWQRPLLVPCQFQFGCYQISVRAARVSGSMTLLDPEPLNIAEPGFGTDFGTFVASNGSQFMVIWWNSGIHARAVSGDGTLGAVMPKIADGFPTTLIWDGSHYVVGFNAGGNVSAARFGGPAFPVADSPDPEESAALARAGNGGLLAAYLRQASEAPYGSVWRVFVKAIAPERPRIRAIR